MNFKIPTQSAMQRWNNYGIMIFNLLSGFDNYSVVSTASHFLSAGILIGCFESCVSVTGWKS